MCVHKNVTIKLIILYNKLYKKRKERCDFDSVAVRINVSPPQL